MLPDPHYWQERAEELPVLSQQGYGCVREDVDFKRAKTHIPRRSQAPGRMESIRASSADVGRKYPGAGPCDKLLSQIGFRWRGPMIRVKSMHSDVYRHLKRSALKPLIVPRWFSRPLTTIEVLRRRNRRYNLA